MKRIGEQHVGILDELLFDEVETIKRGSDGCCCGGGWDWFEGVMTNIKTWEVGGYNVDRYGEMC